LGGGAWGQDRKFRADLTLGTWEGTGLGRGRTWWPKRSRVFESRIADFTKSERMKKVTTHGKRKLDKKGLGTG